MDLAHEKVYNYGIVIVIYDCMTEIESDYYVCHNWQIHDDSESIDEK